MPKYSHGVILVLGLADAEAQMLGHRTIDPAHLLLGLCKSCDLPLNDLVHAAPTEARQILPDIEKEIAEVRDTFERGSLDRTYFRRRLRAILGVGDANADDRPRHRSTASRKVFDRAETLVRGKTPSGTLRPIHLLSALLELEHPPWQLLLGEMNVNGEALVQAARAVQPAADGVEGDEELSRAQEPSRDEADPDQAHSLAQPVLKKFGRDLTRLAAQGKLDPVFGRREEMRTLTQILVQKRKNNAILVGEAGVGKTGIVEGLAQRLAGPKCPAGLKNRRIVEVTMAALVAGTKYRGEFEERMQAVIREAAADKNLILLIDEIHTIMRAGDGEGAMNAANILKPVLARGEIRCIGATTVGEYRQFIEKDPALDGRFQVVWVDEPTRDEAVEILRGLKPRFEEHHGLAIHDDALDAAVELSIRHLPDLRLPDKAIDLIDQACARARMATLSIGPNVSAPPVVHAITREQIAHVVAQRCRIPLDRLTQGEAERLLQMEQELTRRVIGQDEAVRAVSEAIRTARSGLKNPKRPVGVFLFVGPTGTGKTELAKALAQFLFEDQRRLIRLDMTEYMEQHAVARLIGALPGYIGHDEEGQLTGPIRSNPYSVVLLDEIEKAHPRVLDLFLQVLDEGRLTDSRGRRASFTESAIILTSNLGGVPDEKSEGKGPFGFGPPSEIPDSPAVPDREAARHRIRTAVRESLRPELVNRIDRIVFFDTLSPATVRQIIDKLLGGLNEQLHSRAIRLSLTPPVYDLLMAEGYSPSFGAREMERVFERRIVQPLGLGLLEGKIHNGNELITRIVSGSIRFENQTNTRT